MVPSSSILDTKLSHNSSTTSLAAKTEIEENETEKGRKSGQLMTSNSSSSPDQEDVVATRSRITYRAHTPSIDVRFCAEEHF